MRPGCPGSQLSIERVIMLAVGCVDAREHREPPEVRGGLLRRFRDHRNIQAAADHRCNVFERHAFLGNGMQVALRAVLERQPG